MQGDDETSARRRQARGERRIAQILDAGAKVFADVGYEAATTNGIELAGFLFESQVIHDLRVYAEPR